MSSGTVDFDWWTRERVINGLERFIRDVAGGDESKLPVNVNVYAQMIPQDDRVRRKSDKLYPPYAAILRHYPTIGAAWWALGYLVEVKLKNPKYELTDEVRDKLYEIYDTPFRSNGRGSLPGVKAYARSIGLPEHVLTKWAVTLGLSRLKEPPWSDDELALLDEFGYFSPDRIGLIFKERGFTRSKLGILLMRRRRMAMKASPYYSANSLAKLLGIDAHLVSNWIKKGWLRFVMKGTDRGKAEGHQTGDTRLIHQDWLYDFICKHPTAIEFRKVDQLWFLHIVTRGDVAFAVSDPGRISKRSECHQIGAPVEFTKRRLSRVDEWPDPADGETDRGLEYASGTNQPHGTNARYVIGKCRCSKCLNASREYNRELKERQANGTNDPRVPAEKARLHIDALADLGIGYLRVSRLAGVNHNIVWKIKNGDRQNIRFSTEQKILKVTGDDLAQGATIDAAETWEKIEWILAQGMSKTALAKRCGGSTPSLQFGRKLVMIKTANKVAEIYEDVKANGVPDSERPKKRPSGLKSAAKLAANKSHGDRLKYMAGCRCDECRRANTQYELNRAKERKAGRPNGLVPADFAREHIQFLSEQDVGYKQVARLTGVSPTICMKIRSGERKRIRVATETKILNVKPDQVAPRTKINAELTWQRIEWLLANGFTKAGISKALGHKSPALQLNRNHVTKRNADEVEQLYLNAGGPATEVRNV